VTNITIARQRFGKYFPKFTQSTVGGSPLLDSKSLSMFPRQLIDVELIHVVSKADPFKPIQYKARSRYKSQAHSKHRFVIEILK
jgi:hypothetical protein